MIEDIRYLIIFAKIAEIGSMSKGAKALGLSSATVSLHLTKLEKNLGCALFYRNTRKMTLTHDGEKLLDTAQSMLRIYEAGINEFKQDFMTAKKKLNISIPAIFIHGEFMQHITSFCEEHPDLTLNMTCDDTRNDIIADNIDVAFRIGELPSSSLKAKYLFNLPRSIVATQKFMTKYGTLSDPEDLKKAKWIGLNMIPNSRILKNKETGIELEVTYNPHIYVNNVEASYQLMKLDAGLAAPPDYLIEEDLQNNRLLKVLPEWELKPLNVYAVWPANIAISGIAYALIQKIYDSFN